ncbi:DUF1702 family protein [Micromonospora sp. CPCC 206060]|uniref:DUF1702 family protein n=1 Tax=Micromonospora sp. CPCC 206060 TaxID=3122406 RepID=UPI002FEF0DCC
MPRLPLPMRMADFQRRGFRLDRPASRAILEQHAHSFLTGFNLAALHWRDRHDVLAEVPDPERGFAYEGAAMFASQLDLCTAGRARAVEKLLAGPGDRYIHLIHVGAGWTLAPMRLPLPRLPRAPLMRWLALDGAGFGETFFGGLPALRRRARRPASDRWAATVAGSGRALWFVESADVDGIATVINDQPPAARPHLWSGVGLACGYAGAVNGDEIDRLPALAAGYLPHLRQGVTFAVGARARSGIVPPHTEDVCRRLLGTDVHTVHRWTTETSRDLESSPHLAAYLEWKSRLRALVAESR